MNEWFTELSPPNSAADGGKFRTGLVGVRVVQCDSAEVRLT
jgi:hypothetical protein